MSVDTRPTPRPICCDRQSLVYRSNVGEVSVDCRWGIGRPSVRYRWYRSTVNRCSNLLTNRWREGRVHRLFSCVDGARMQLKLRWDLTFPVRVVIKLPISVRDRHLLLARFSKKQVHISYNISYHGFHYVSGDTDWRYMDKFFPSCFCSCWNSAIALATFIAWLMNERRRE